MGSKCNYENHKGVMCNQALPHGMWERFTQSFELKADGIPKACNAQQLQNEHDKHMKTFTQNRLVEGMVEVCQKHVKSFMSS